MDDFEAAGIIEQVFPKYTLIFKTNQNLQIESLHDALMYARTKCGSNTLGDCIVWARKYQKSGDVK